MTTRNVVINFMMTQDEKEELEILSQYHGRSMASLLRWLVKKEAEKVLEAGGDG